MVFFVIAKSVRYCRRVGTVRFHDLDQIPRTEFIPLFDTYTGFSRSLHKLPCNSQINIFIHVRIVIIDLMCISYSGRCLLSNYFTGRDANRGACTHPWKIFPRPRLLHHRIFPAARVGTGTPVGIPARKVIGKQTA